jgi:hypothetical protein
MDNKDVYVMPKERIGGNEEWDEPATTTLPAPVAEEAAPEPTEEPLSIEDIIAGLRGFGIEENEEILTFNSRGGKKVRLRITNLPTDEEIKALVSAEEYKGYAWIQRIRVEILSRSISWVDGVDVRSLREKNIPIRDFDGVARDIQVVLRNTIMGWGQELVMTLWKIAMVHSDKIEKRYQNDFPDSTLMTDVERRFMETVLKEIEDSSKDVITDSLQQLFDETGDETS